MPLSTLYEDHKLHHPIYNLELPFSEYIIEYQHLIRSTRIDVRENADNVMLANSPFEFKPDQPNQKGVLLIHGLLDSPFIMRDIAIRLQQQGYLVRAILLPGHGTTPGDLLNVHYEEWIQAVRYGIASFRHQVDQLYLAGFSTGANLGLYHALHGAHIAGLILLCPAIRIRTRLDFSTNWHRVISWAWKRAQWLHLLEENDYAKYQSIPFNAAWQVYQLTRVIKKLSKTHQASCPLFFILSLADSTVSAQASITYFQQHLKPENHLLLYAKNFQHQQDANTLVRSSVYPELRIHEFSHVAIPVAPDNFHYGKHGDYIHASHIEDGSQTVYGAFNRVENMLFDFLYKNKLSPLRHKRLSFNPDFDFMMQEIMRFLAR